jgi:hypothetical protein
VIFSATISSRPWLKRREVSEVHRFDYSGGVEVCQKKTGAGEKKRAEYLVPEARGAGQLLEREALRGATRPAPR